MDMSAHVSAASSAENAADNAGDHQPNMTQGYTRLYRYRCNSKFCGVYKRATHHARHQPRVSLSRNKNELRQDVATAQALYLTGTRSLLTS